MKVILGSASPRRRGILSIFFNDFSVMAPDVVETAMSDETPEFFAMRTSIDKCDECLKNITDGDFLLITSDTIVAIGSTILGKPSGTENARQTLLMLSGKNHRVITALTLHFSSAGKSIRETRIETTNVKFRDINPATADEYLSKVDCLDKAGSYAVQEHGDLIIESVNGSISSVIGFPCGLFIKMMNDMGILGLFTGV